MVFSAISMTEQKKYVKELLELGFIRKSDSLYTKTWELPEKTLYMDVKLLSGMTSETVEGVVFILNIEDDYSGMNVLRRKVANPEDISVEIEEILKKAYEKLVSYASRVAEIVMTGI